MTKRVKKKKLRYEAIRLLESLGTQEGIIKYQDHIIKFQWDTCDVTSYPNDSYLLPAIKIDGQFVSYTKVR